MFSDIPPFKKLCTRRPFSSVPCTVELFHEFACNTQYRFRGEERSSETHCIFQYTLKGRGQVVRRGVSYDVHPGEGFFNIINEPGSGYGYPEDGTESWEFICLCFEGGSTREITAELLERQSVYSIKEHEALFHAMCKRLLNDDDTEIRLTFLPKLLVMLDSTNRTPNAIVTRFQEIAEQELMMNPTISSIAAEMQISREHLHREYLRETGITPAKHLNNRRFEQLCCLLTTSAPEEEIAAAMHFPSAAGMAAFFKRFTGITPRQYRRNGFLTV